MRYGAAGGLLGLRRLRPGAAVQYSSVLHESGHSRATLNGERVESSDGPFLWEFCASEALKIETRIEGNRVHYILADNGVGPKSAVDLWLAEFYTRNHPRWRRAGPGERRVFYATVEQPARTLIFDMLVHEDTSAGRWTGMVNVSAPTVVAFTIRFTVLRSAWSSIRQRRPQHREA